MASNKEQLVDFLEKRAFDPVMRAKPDDYPQSKHDELKDVQDSTRSEIERFHNYGSAEEVLINFRRDLNSEPAERIHRELDDLGLPTINDVRDDFERLADDLGVKG